MKGLLKGFLIISLMGMMSCAHHGKKHCDKSGKCKDKKACCKDKGKCKKGEKKGKCKKDKKHCDKKEAESQA